MYEQRDIVLIPFPYTDLTGAKQRPALVLSNRTIEGNDRICCLITSKEAKDGIRLKKDDLEGTLPLQSWVKPHRVFTIRETIVRKRLCRISGAMHKRILERLDGHVALE